MTSTNLTVAQINKTIETQLADKQTVLALITTTFNGMSEQTMRQAMLEGMMRGFEFKDFLQKDVYAIPYGNKYSLVTSIDYMRKIAAQNGLAGKEAPVYEDDANGLPKTCSVTVKRMVGGTLGDYTATVYFSEYTTGKNQWVSKPRTMIAKVAEMHALRMAFPEELAKSYIEGEQESGAAIAAEIDLNAISAKCEACKTTEELRAVWESMTAEEKGNKEVIRLVNERKQAIKEYVKPIEAEVTGDTTESK